MAFVAIKIGRRQGARSGAYLNRYATDEQRSRRPIFIATLGAVVSWLFFRVARALKNSQLTDGESHVIYGTDTKIKPCKIGPPETPAVVISIFLD
jgi:hypothetical protein